MQQFPNTSTRFKGHTYHDLITYTEFCSFEASHELFRQIWIIDGMRYPLVFDETEKIFRGMVVSWFLHTTLLRHRWSFGSGIVFLSLNFQQHLGRSIKEWMRIRIPVKIPHDKGKLLQCCEKNMDSVGTVGCQRNLFIALASANFTAEMAQKILSHRFLHGFWITVPAITSPLSPFIGCQVGKVGS